MKKVRKIRKSGVLVYGVGVNDADYCVKPTLKDGTRTWCPYYRSWVRMLERGYCSKLKLKQPTYKDVTVCEEWHLFSNFKAWMEKQEWQGKPLDKDILIQGNRIYSPDSCMFVTVAINSLLTDNAIVRGRYPLGVSLYKPKGNFRAQINVNSKVKGLGYFETPMEAHKAWQIAKKQIIYDVTLEQTDERLKAALLFRCDQLKYDIDNGLETIKL